MLRSVIIASLMAMLCSCSTAPVTIKLPEVEQYASSGSKFEGESTVYIFRGASRGGWSYPLRVSLGKTKIGSIGKETYLVFPVAEGTQLISIDCPYDCAMPDIKVNADLKAGRTYYFVVESDLHVGLALGSMQTRSTVGVLQVEEPYALRLLDTYVVGSQSK
jgi:hypothetical protein